MDQLARRMNVTLKVALECDSLQIQKHMVLRSGLYAVLAEHAVARERAAGELQAALIVKPSLTRSITLAMSEVRPMTLASREVAHILRGSLEEIGQAIGGLQ
jgi:DNA-binding transcriptional LysR family regulator